jgi:inorganic pyrophosphatase/exopolyphosphatase
MVDSLIQFLCQSKQLFLSQTCELNGVHVFLGNEACDADSLVSSVLYAYLSSNRKRKLNEVNTTIIIPIIPIPKTDLVLRAEIVFLLQRCGGFKRWADSLLFINEFSFEVSIIVFK